MDALQLSNRINEISRNADSCMSTLISMIDTDYQWMQDEYLGFIKSDSINSQKLLYVLNELRILYKVNEALKQVPIKHDSKEEFSISDDYTREMLLSQIKMTIEKLAENTREIRNVSTDSFDIEDEIEFEDTQHKIRGMRKKIRSYEELCAKLLLVIDQYLPIQFSQPEGKVFSSAVKDGQESSKATQTEKDFYQWMLTKGNLTEPDANKIIVNIHRIENLYKKLFKNARMLLPVPAENEIMEIITQLLSSTEYVDADSRRDHSFNDALNVFCQFIGVEVHDLQNNSITDTETIMEDKQSVLSSASITADEEKYLFQKAPEAKTVTEKQETVSETPKASFVPDETKPFVLKDAIIEIMTSDATEIIERRGYGGGFNNKTIFEILKEFYGQTINMFSITSLLMRDNAFVNVGKLHYTVDKNRFNTDEEELMSRISDRDIIQDDKPSVVQENSSAPLIHSSIEDSASDHDRAITTEPQTEPSAHHVKTEAETIVEAEQPSKQDHTSLKDAVLKVIWENREALEYRDGFGTYEVRTLLSKMGITADEHEIETVMENSSELDEIEDGYYVYYGEWQGNLVEASEPEDEIPDEPVEVETDEPKEDETSLVRMNPASDHSSVKLVINGREMNACHIQEALDRICEFAISCKPFAMARMADANISLNDRKVFYRQSVPVNGYHHLSNGLQVINIDSLLSLSEVTEELMTHCGIGNNIIKII